MIDLSRAIVNNDLIALRSRLIDYIWKGPIANVPPLVVSAYPPSGIVVPPGTMTQRFQFNMPMGYISNLYYMVPANLKWNPITLKGKLAIVSQGHGDYWGIGNVDWVVNQLLTLGYAVLLCAMPLSAGNTGPVSSHNAMAATETPTWCPLRIFFDPIISALNWMGDIWDSILMTGVSGGGWASHWLPALDARINYSVAVAGSLPLFLRAIPNDVGDWEQGAMQCDSLMDSVYHIASWLELYVLASSNGRHVQVQNWGDPGAFAGKASTLYESAIRSRSNNQFGTLIDCDLPQDHHISQTCFYQIIAPLLGEPVPTIIVDDWQANCTFTGPWSVFTGQGYGNSVHSVAASSAIKASWRHFVAVEGLYRVRATWSPNANRTTAATYTVKQNGVSLGQSVVDQRATPSDLINGTYWEPLGDYNLQFGPVCVELTALNGYAIADATSLGKLNG